MERRVWPAGGTSFTDASRNNAIRQNGESRIWPPRVRLSEEGNSLFHKQGATDQDNIGASRRIVDLVMKGWKNDVGTFCFRSGWPVSSRWNDIKGRRICDEICAASMNELSLAVKEFKKERCLLGLVLIAGLAKNYAKNEAVGALRHAIMSLGGNKEPIKRICSLVPVQENWNKSGLIVEGHGTMHSWTPLPAEILG